MYRVFVADELAPEGLDALAKYNQLDVDFSPGLSIEEAIPHAREADAIIVRSATKIRGTLLDAAARVKVIGRAGIGVDNIDLDATTERGIVVLNTPDANATTTAELAIAHMFSLSRNLPAADRSVRAGKWERNKFLGNELSGKTVGVIGFGTIGRLAASRCVGLNMTVLGYDPFVTEQTFTDHGVQKTSLDELLQDSDYVSLHCPVTEQTKGLINRERLLLMKRGARLINCARGGLVDEQSLLELVQNRHLAGAALDVYENEPPGESALLKEANIHFTPHLGASTQEAQTAVGVEIANQIASFLLRGEVTNAVNVPSIAPDKLVKLAPYMDLARRLGQILGIMMSRPLNTIEVGVFGEASRLDSHPINSSAMVGLLKGHHSVPVNQINALHLARRQGITLTETHSTDSKDYISMVRVSAGSDDEVLSLAGTLFDDRYPRLVRVGDCEVECPLEGNLLFTRHSDEPGVIGTLGDILGQRGINISRMQVGESPDADLAIAVLTVSHTLSDDTMQEISNMPAVYQALQIAF